MPGQSRKGDKRKRNRNVGEVVSSLSRFCSCYRLLRSRRILRHRACSKDRQLKGVHPNPDAVEKDVPVPEFTSPSLVYFNAYLQKLKLIVQCIFDLCRLAPCFDPEMTGARIDLNKRFNLFFSACGSPARCILLCVDREDITYGVGHI